MARLSDKNQQVRQSSAPLSAGKAGFIQQHGGTTAPSGWLECSGQAVSRTDYAQLFANISTKYGVGDGSTTFNLPDGPRKTLEITPSFSSTPTGWSTTYGSAYYEQRADGTWWARISFAGTSSVVTADGQSITVDGVTFSGTNIGVADEGSPGQVPFTLNTSGSTIVVNAETGQQFNGLSGTIYAKLSGKPTDSAVSNDGNFSTFDEALESIPIIKLYDDVADAVSVGVAEATASEVGTVKTADSYYHNYDNSGSIAIGTLESISITKPGKYLVLFSATFSGASSNSSRANQVIIEHESTVIVQSFTQVANTDASTDYGTGTTHTIVDLAASDTLDFIVTSVGTTTIQTYSITISPIVLTSNTSDSVGTVT